jgi:preprotein translocase subunit SecB
MTTPNTVTPTPGIQNPNEPEFAIRRIYIKDVSLEAPNSPEIFQMEWKPEVTLDLDTKTHHVSDDLHEVALKITATVKNSTKTAFLIEVVYAGLFTLKGFANDQLHYMLGSFCPNIIFPYAREIISETVSRAGFPPLYLAPVNFDALYQKHFAESKEKADKEGKKV